MDYLSAVHVFKRFFKIDRAVLYPLLKAELIRSTAEYVYAGIPGYRIRYRVECDIAVAVGGELAVKRNVNAAQLDGAILFALTESVAVLTYRADISILTHSPSSYIGYPFASSHITISSAPHS